jgi:Fe-S-cluster containining protein
MITEMHACRRCGTCCIRGGPALHDEDLQLLQNGYLHEKDLYTLRIGEPVFDQIQNAILLLDSECIKVRSVEYSTVCRYYLPSPGGCSIYSSRPIECVALKCWDTSALAEVSSANRLSRSDIISNDSILRTLIQEHEAHCGCAELLRWLRQGSEDSRQALKESVAFDAAMRAMLPERINLPSERLMFLLGRPLPEVIKNLERWLRLERRPGRGYP